MIWFEVIMGLHVNYSKSSLYLVNDVNDGDGLMDLSGCKRGSFPDVNLGMPLGAKLRKKGLDSFD